MCRLDTGAESWLPLGARAARIFRSGSQRCAAGVVSIRPKIVDLRVGTGVQGCACRKVNMPQL